MARKQRKSKFAININNAGGEETTMAVINDLLRKYPRGCDGRLGNKSDYNDTYASDPCLSRAGDFCGYSWEQLWILMNAYVKSGGTPYGTIENLVEKHWKWSGDKEKHWSSYMPSSTNTRRTRRLQSRLGRIARHWREQGRKAIYEWKPSYSSGHLRDTPFYVWGNDMTDARAQVEIVWVPILNATGLAGTDSYGRERVLEANNGNIKMHTETSDAGMTSTSALTTMQSLMSKRQAILSEIAKMKETADQMSSLIEFVSQAAEG